jgi:hypothetical protein
MSKENNIIKSIMLPFETINQDFKELIEKNKKSKSSDNDEEFQEELIKTDDVKKNSNNNIDDIPTINNVPGTQKLQINEITELFKLDKSNSKKSKRNKKNNKNNDKKLSQHNEQENFLSHRKNPNNQEFNSKNTVDINNNQQQLLLERVNIESEIKDEQLDQILKDICEIKEISKDMGELLTEQNESLNKIEKNIDKAEINIVKSDKELNKAAKYKNDDIINVLSVTTGSVIGSIFGPPGALAGAGLATSLSINFVADHIKKD